MLPMVRPETHSFCNLQFAPQTDSAVVSLGCRFKFRDMFASKDRQSLMQKGPFRHTGILKAHLNPQSGLRFSIFEKPAKARDFVDA